MVSTIQTLSKPSQRHFVGGFVSGILNESTTNGTNVAMNRFGALGIARVHNSCILTRPKRIRARHGAMECQAVPITKAKAPGKIGTVLAIVRNVRMVMSTNSRDAFGKGAAGAPCRSLLSSFCAVASQRAGSSNEPSCVILVSCERWMDG